MKTNTNRLKPAAPAKLPISRPTIITLFARIVGAAVTGGMLWLMFFGGALIAFLEYNHLPAGHLPVLMIFAVMVVALLRGIRAWQDDLDEYQRNLTEYRMNMADIRNKHVVKKDIAWHRH
jgi:membrane protein implicated in regulation of membrane protease activity